MCLKLARLKKDAAKSAAVKVSAGLTDDGFPRPAVPTPVSASAAAGALPVSAGRRGMLVEAEHAEKLEILALNLNAVKSEEEDLAKEIIMLERQRNTHVR